MRNAILTLLLAGMACPLAIAQNNDDRQGVNVPAYYDARNGNLTIDTTEVTGGELAGYVLFGQELIADNHTPFMNSAFVTSTDSTVGESNFAGIAGGVYSLGNILPAGLVQDDVRDMYFAVDDDGNVGGPGERFPHYVLGAIGSRTFHLMEPIHSPSPFPAINDGTVGVPQIQDWAESVSLIYDPFSGGLTIDSNRESGGTMWTYRILFESDVVDVDAFTPATEIIGASVRSDSITEVGFAGIPAGIYDLGSVLPAGMTVSEFSATVKQANFIGEPGKGVEGLDFAVNGLQMSLAIVPEPSGSTILFSLGLGWTLLRRQGFSFFQNGAVLSHRRGAVSR